MIELDYFEIFDDENDENYEINEENANKTQFSYTSKVEYDCVPMTVNNREEW